MDLLLVEDDEKLAQFVAKGLREAGHIVEHIADGRDGVFAVAAGQYDVVILDRMLPAVDGLTILQAMRATGDETPVLVVSALGEIDDRVEGLRKGGDDYIAKPFALSELLARVEALGRRTTPIRERTRLSAGTITIDLASRQVRKAGRLLNITSREFRILEYLVRHSDRVVTRDMLMEVGWDYQFDPQTNVVDQHVSRLRQKLDDGEGRSLIETVRGVGYVVRRGKLE